MKNFIRECLVLSAVVLSMTACNDSFLERAVILQHISHGIGNALRGIGEGSI